jgi:hypothetical protein
MTIAIRYDILHAMDNETKFGILLIIIGILIPLASAPFMSGFSRDKGIIDNLYDASIPIRENHPADAINPASGDSDSSKGKTGIQWSRLIPKRIPFRFFLVPTLIFSYMGIVRIDRARRRRRGEYDDIEGQEDQPAESEKESK